LQPLTQAEIVPGNVTHKSLWTPHFETFTFGVCRPGRAKQELAEKARAMRI
jgi:hypothetical protein